MDRPSRGTMLLGFAQRLAIRSTLPPHSMSIFSSMRRPVSGSVWKTIGLSISSCSTVGSSHATRPSARTPRRWLESCRPAMPDQHRPECIQQLQIFDPPRLFDPRREAGVASGYDNHITHHGLPRFSSPGRDARNVCADVVDPVRDLARSGNLQPTQRYLRLGRSEAHSNEIPVGTSWLSTYDQKSGEPYSNTSKVQKSEPSSRSSCAERSSSRRRGPLGIVRWAAR